MYYIAFFPSSIYTLNPIMTKQKQVFTFFFANFYEKKVKKYHIYISVQTLYSVLCWSAQDLRLGQRLTFQQDNNPNHTAKTTKEWLRNKSLNVLELGLEPYRTSLERPENSCAATLPTWPDRALEDLQGMGENPQIQVWQACSIIPIKTQGCNRCLRCHYGLLCVDGWENIYFEFRLWNKSWGMNTFWMSLLFLLRKM